jgi:hypothetical protein
MSIEHEENADLLDVPDRVLRGQRQRLLRNRETDRCTANCRAENSGEYCLAVQVNGISYLVHYVPFFRASYVPTDMIVGDPIQVRIKDNEMSFVHGSKTATAKILRRERISPDSPPAN